MVARIAVRQVAVLLSVTISVIGAEETPSEDSVMHDPVRLAPEFTDLTEHRGNRALHFALELSIWSAGGFWGYDQASGIGGVALAAAIPVATVASWTAFSVPGDPWLPGGRGGTQPKVAIPGWLRITYEVGLHGLSVWAMHDLGWESGAAAMAGGTLLHYSVSYQRVAWLLGLRAKTKMEDLE